MSNTRKGTRSEVKNSTKRSGAGRQGRTVKKPEKKITEEDQGGASGKSCIHGSDCVLPSHKPAGYVSATEDRYDRTVMELIPEARKGMLPVGRLDKDTEGLLITDDGGLAHELLSPAHHVEKTYLVRVRER